MIGLAYILDFIVLGKMYNFFFRNSDKEKK